MTPSSAVAMITSISTIFTGWSIWRSTSSTAAMAPGLPRTMTEFVRWSIEMLGRPIAPPRSTSTGAPAAAAACGWPRRDASTGAKGAGAVCWTE